MESIDFCWEPWEVEGLSRLRRYLTENSEKRFVTIPVVNYLTEEKVAEKTRYRLKDFTDVVVSQEYDGSGQITVIGEVGLDKKLSKLKELIGFRKLQPTLR